MAQMLRKHFLDHALTFLPISLSFTPTMQRQRYAVKTKQRFRSFVGIDVALTQVSNRKDSPYERYSISIFARQCNVCRTRFARWRDRRFARFHQAGEVDQANRNLHEGGGGRR